MSDELIDPERIGESARRIAHGLGLRSTRQQLPGRIVTRIHRLLVAAQGVGGVYPRVAAICQQIYPVHKRHFLTSLVLLDRLWLVPPGTQVAQDVVRLLRESYHLCDRASFKAILRDELVEKQWSSFRVVRHAASQIREIEAVDASEGVVLRDDRAFSDVRTAVARRILLHRQTEHLGSLLAYLVETVRTGGEDGEEREQAVQMLRQLHDFGMSAVLVPLSRAYVEHFADESVRGYLMVALAALGEPLVPQLEELYRGDVEGAWRRPIMRLLHQMIARGSRSAVRALTEIVTHARGSELDEAAWHLLIGARERAARGQQAENTLLIRDHLEALAQHLEGAPEATHRRLGRDLAAIGWDGAVTTELIERVVALLATQEERQQLRYGGRRAAELLLAIIESETRTTRQRTAALKALPTIYGVPGRPGPEGLLWQLYRQAGEEELRLAALCCLADLELVPPDPASRQILYEESHDGTPAAQQCIRECWAQLFPQAPPPGTLKPGAPTEDRP